VSADDAEAVYTSSSSRISRRSVLRAAGRPETTLTSRRVPTDQTMTTSEDISCTIEHEIWIWVEGITGISGVKSHVQVTCVRSRMRLTRKMDRGGEIENN
jgi:hypothetical protein